MHIIHNYYEHTTIYLHNVFYTRFAALRPELAGIENLALYYIMFLSDHEF